MALIVITGGARSGKSSAAQRLAATRQAAGGRVVVAVFGSAEGDPEMAARIGRHRAERPEGFRTLEAKDPRSWRGTVADHEILLLDCLGTLAALFVDELVGAGYRSEEPLALEQALTEALADTRSWLTARSGDSIVVTNEVGSGVVPAYPVGRVFRDVLGRANTDLVSAADAAYFAICGRLIELTDFPDAVTWPGEE